MNGLAGRVRRRAGVFRAGRKEGDGDKGRGGRRRLLRWEELAPWQQEGAGHILTGYRAESTSAAECLASWSYLHNDTVNVLSHLLGAGTFLALIPLLWAAEIPPRYAVATRADVLVCGGYLLGVAACFMISVVFHTFLPHKSLTRVLLPLDFQGILLLMWSATLPLAQYTFPAQPGLRDAHVLLSTLGAGAVLAAGARAADRGNDRAGLLGVFGAGTFGGVAAHAALLRTGGGGQGPAPAIWSVGGWWVGGTGVLNGLGMVCYTAKFPERWWPGRFDVFGASHQIMHVTVLLAALAYAKAVVMAFDHLHGLAV